MKLLLDQNISRRLVARLDSIFPGTAHVANVGLERADDQQVWTFARDNGFAIVSKDADFADLSVLHGPPPKVIWLQLGNCTTQDIEDVVIDQQKTIETFDADKDAGLLDLL